MSGSGDGRTQGTRRWLQWLALAVVVAGSVVWFASFAGGSSSPVLFAVWPLVMLASAYLLFRVVFPFLTSGRAGAPDPARVAAVRASGPALWSGYPGGVVGGMQATAAMLGASVHPGGIVVTPRFMRPYAIPAREIRGITFGKRFTTQTIVVEHAGVDIASPLVLYGSQSSAQAMALGWLLDRTRADSGTAAEGASPPRALPGAWSAGPVRMEAPPRPPAVMTVMSAIGLLVGVGLVVYGLTWAIPHLGAFGVVWTGFGVVVLAGNAVRFVRRGW